MKIENMDLNLYNQVFQGTSAYDVAKTTAAKVTAATVAEKGEDSAAAVEAVSGQNADRVDFSKDTAVIGEMTAEERAELVKSLKADQETQMSRFMNMMTQMFQKQGITGLTAGSDEFWRMIASGNYAVDAQTRAKAQEAISEDGYWGVKQTSQRIFDFAYAVAGDDTDKMREMQEAVEKGFHAAEKSWGGPMPAITGETYNAVTELFNQYYASYEEE